MTITDQNNDINVLCDKFHTQNYIHPIIGWRIFPFEDDSVHCLTVAYISTLILTPDNMMHG